MKIVHGLVLAAGALALAAGCGEANYTRAERYEQGLVIVLGGAGGMMGETERIRDGLNSGGVDRAIEVFEWSQGGVLEDQTSVDQNRRKASQLARRVEAYQSEYRGRPVHLVGVSAGTGLVVWGLEDLREGATVTGAVLIASSLDTKYNLGSALRRVTDHIYSFNSLADTVLSLGVTWTGTVDRGGGLAGGFVGFSPPDKATEAEQTLYKERLTQIAWWPGDMVLGHLGDHLGATNPSFVRARIAPLVLGKKLEEIESDQRAKREVAARKAAEEARREAEAKKTELARRREDEKRADETRKTVADARRADLTRKSDEIRRAADAARKADEARGGAARASDKKEDKQRFFDWSVGQGAAPPPALSPDEAQFFRDSGRLP